MLSRVALYLLALATALCGVIVSISHVYLNAGLGHLHQPAFAQRAFGIAHRLTPYEPLALAAAAHVSPQPQAAHLGRERVLRNPHDAQAWIGLLDAELVDLEPADAVSSEAETYARLARDLEPASPRVALQLYLRLLRHWPALSPEQRRLGEELQQRAIENPLTFYRYLALWELETVFCGLNSLRSTEQKQCQELARARRHCRGELNAEQLAHCQQRGLLSVSRP